MSDQDQTAAPPRILIVDDDLGTVRLLTRILSELGEIHHTTQASKALVMAQSIMPDLILLDVEMPDQDGFEICALLKADTYLSNIPILFVTSHTEPALEVRALKAGAIDFIHKPPYAEIVKARVGNYLALKQRNDQLQQLTMLDGLTGIANRRAFDTAIAREWRRACRGQHPLSLLMIDVDHFKAYNDTHGHLMGDNALRAVGACLRSKTRRPGDLAARFGGEEFAVLLPECDLKNALEFAESIRHEVEQIADPDLPPVTVSIGVAENSEPCKHLDQCWRAQDANAGRLHRLCHINPLTLIAQADSALYQAKHGGRNCVASAGG